MRGVGEDKQQQGGYISSYPSTRTLTGYISLCRNLVGGGQDRGGLRQAVENVSGRGKGGSYLVVARRADVMLNHI